MPASKRLFVVQNDCGQDVAVTTGAGAAVVLTAGQRRLLYGDGTDVVAVAPDFASVGGGAGGGSGFPVFQGALIKRTTNATIASGVQTVLGWESAVYDTDAFVDLVGQPTRLTVPAGKGITRAQVLYGIEWAPSASGDRWVEIHKNGVEVDGLPAYLSPTDGNFRSRIALTSAPIDVADGDYFECLVWQNVSSDLNVDAAPQTWFAVVAIEFAAFRGAMVKLTADETIADETTLPGTRRVRNRRLLERGRPPPLTVPAGVSRVRLIGNPRWGNDGSGNRQAWLTKNGAGFPGAPMVMHGAEGVVGQNLATLALPVSAGDFFELAAWHSAGGTIDVEAGNQSWFGVEVVE